ncbi:FtsX-like permease family protein [Anaerosporobacter sp.]|uniref:FtsX-like permease family protein n=1 Tax=Anaerosporobacter sp. TaxID=1872529 RepID=UPI00286F766D|nr:FtsX-like permease family protein [Anaerosporobacter sp.]
MNIMNSLTWKHMKANKKRTIVTILGVIISVAMITAVSTAALTFTTYLQNIQIKHEGAWHVRYNNVTQTQADTLLEELDEEFSFYTQIKGYSKWKDTSTVEKPYIYVEAYDKAAFDKLPMTVMEGRIPEQIGEIIVSKEIACNKERSYKIGDTITMEYGKRFAKIDGVEKELGQNEQYYGEGFSEEEKETWESTGEQATYTIVGIMQSNESFISPGREAITFLDVNGMAKDETRMASLFMNEVSNSIYKQATLAAEHANVGEKQIEYQDNLLRLYGVSRYENSYNKMIQVCTTILILIIMVGSIALIYNSFAISINERSKQFGMLSSIGATREQKRNAVLFEGAVIAVISIPLGVIAGYVGMWTTFKILEPILENVVATQVGIKVVVSMKSIASAVLFSVITIFISAYLPARKAAKITPIEAIRQSTNIAIRAKHMKTSRLTQKMLGVSGDLAVKNLRRNRKHYRALVFSLAISLSLFISVGSYVYYLKESVNFSIGNKSYDAIVMNIDKEEMTELSEHLEQLPSVTEGNSVISLRDQLIIEEDQIRDRMTEEYKTELNETYADISDIAFVGVLCFIPDAEYEKMVGESIESEGIHGTLINQQVKQWGYSLTDIEQLNIKKGETITIGEYDIQLDLVTKNRPLGVSVMGLGGTVSIIMPLSELSQFKEADDVYCVYYLNTNDVKNIEDAIVDVFLKNGFQSNYSIYNQAMEVVRNNQITTVFSVFAYGFITLISLICVANLFNTISTSFALRRREFAMLKSIGMTPETFNRMIRMESLMYGVKACIFGLPISLAMTLWIKKGVGYNFNKYYAFPYQIYIIGIVIVFAVVGIAMLYSSRKVRKENIVDALTIEVN